MKNFLTKSILKSFYSKALLVIDVQNEYFTGVLPIEYPENTLENIIKIMEVAESSEIPIYCVQHCIDSDEAPFFRVGSDEWKVHEKIEEFDYELIQKQTISTGTGLPEKLESQGIDTVVITGYMTHMCCDTTSRQAAHRGYEIEFLSDATATLSFSNDGGTALAEELHRCTLVSQGTFFARIIDTNTWIEENS